MNATRRRQLLYRGNARMRALGLSPRPVGESPARDRTKARLLQGLQDAKSGLRRLAGRGVRDDGQAYAPA